MVSKIEKMLIECLTSPELGMRKEPVLIIVSLLTTEKQRGTMVDWLIKHYQENPSEDKILEIAELIREKVK